MAAPRFLAPLLTVALLGAGGYFVYQRFATPAEVKVEYVTQPLERARISATVTASGTLSPVKTVAVGSQVSGRILELMADFNSQVKQGDIIARIDPSLFQSDVMRSKANHKSAQAALARAIADRENARLNFERAQQLQRDGVVAAAEVDAAQAAYKIAKASVDASEAAVTVAKAAIEQSDVNLLYTTILSPIDGVVISRDVSVGQTVAASLSAPTLFTIAEDLKAMEVHTSVAESDVGLLKPDMRVRFTVDAYPNERFTGKVWQIRNAPQTLQNVVTYDAVVRVENDELKLRPGMTASVTFIIDERRDALAVPNAALRFTPSDPKLLALAPKPDADEGRGRGRGRRNREGEDAAREGEGKAEETKAEAPKVEEAKAEETKAEEAKAEDPKVEEAKAASDTKGAARKGAAKKGAAKKGGDGSGVGDVQIQAVVVEGAAEDPKAEEEQRERWRARRAQRAAEAAATRTVWVLDNGQPRPVQVKIGISDMSMTEIVEGELTEGMLVIVGARGNEPPAAEKRPSSPFANPAGGGRGGGGGGGRRGGGM